VWCSCPESTSDLREPTGPGNCAADLPFRTVARHAVVVSSVSANLAANIRALRERDGLSQQQIAKLANVPRPTWANLESGDANPTVSVLTKVAAALRVGVEQLLEPPKARATLIKAAALTSKKRGKAHITSLTADLIQGVSLERIALAPSGQFSGRVQPGAHRLILACESGEPQVMVEQILYQLQPGDVLALRVDQSWSCRNASRSRCVVYQLISGGV
jgi:XRE family transcriptional regulator, regulator of sulfur utilization